jgi:3-oxoacyl-[acyl-carrier protein] reductase
MIGRSIGRPNQRHGRPRRGEQHASYDERSRRRRHRWQQGDRARRRTAIRRLRRQGRDAGARRAGPESRAGLAKDGLAVRDYVCDVSKAADISKAHEKIVADLGPVDVLVNNAGTARTMAFENISDEAWQEDLDLKLFAAIRFSRLVWPGMKARKWGRIINVLNTYAKAPAASSAPTSVSRAAGMALTKVMASEGGEHNILVNAMLVGLIMSDQWVKRHAAQAPDMDFEVFAKNLAKGTPLGRIGTAEEFANLACFLASEQGSFITGTAINVDGGRSPVV